MGHPRIERGFARTPGGQIHYAAAGHGKPVVFLLQTPRSWVPRDIQVLSVQCLFFPLTVTPSSLSHTLIMAPLFSRPRP